jgi:energy-coupling factor transporter transmembrane protein EcfT
MTIQSEINKDDWNAYVQFIRNQMKKGGNKNAKAWFLVICFGAAIGFGATVAKIPIDLFSIIAGSFGTSLWIIILSRSKLKSMQRNMQPSEDGVIIGPCSISVGNDGIKTITPNCETFYRWQTVRRAEVADKHIFVVVDNIAAITIPRRSFSSADEQEKFLGEIRQRSRS